MPIKLTKAIELLELDLKEADAKASPDRPDAVRLGLVALKTIRFYRNGGTWHFKALLEGEEPEEQMTIMIVRARKAARRQKD